MISPFAGGSAFWSVVAVGLLWLVAHQVTDEQPTLSNVVAAPAGTSGDEKAVETNSVVALPSENLVERIVERPLFSETRRTAPPAMPQRPEADEAPDEALSLELIGTILVGDVRVALVKHPAKGLIRRRPGQSIGDWTLVDVEKHRVSLEGEDDLKTLTLRKDRIKRPKPHSLNKPSATDATANQERKPPAPPVPASALTRRPI